MSIAFDAENEDLSWPPRLLQKRRSRLPERRRFAVASSELSPDRTKEAARAAGDKRRAFPLSERSVLAQRAPNNSLDPFAHSFITQARGRSRVAQAFRLIHPKIRDAAKPHPCVSSRQYAEIRLTGRKSAPNGAESR